MTSRFGTGDAKFHYGGEPGPDRHRLPRRVRSRRRSRRSACSTRPSDRNQDYELNFRLRAAGGVGVVRPRSWRSATGPRDSLRASPASTSSTASGSAWCSGATPARCAGARPSPRSQWVPWPRGWLAAPWARRALVLPALYAAATARCRRRRRRPRRRPNGTARGHLPDDALLVVGGSPGRALAAGTVSVIAAAPGLRSRPARLRVRNAPAGAPRRPTSVQRPHRRRTAATGRPARRGSGCGC